MEHLATRISLPLQSTLSPHEEGWETSLTSLSLEIEKPRESGLVKKGEARTQPRGVTQAEPWKGGTKRISVVHATAGY